MGATVGVAGKVIAGSGLELAADEALPCARRKKIPPMAKKAAKTIKTARSWSLVKPKSKYRSRIRSFISLNIPER
jgi:hypothetical protein